MVAERQLGVPNWEAEHIASEQEHLGRPIFPKSPLRERYEALPEGAKQYLNLAYRTTDPSLTNDRLADLKQQQFRLQSKLRLEAPDEWSAFVDFVNFRDTRFGGRNGRNNH